MPAPGRPRRGRSASCLLLPVGLLAASCATGGSGGGPVTVPGDLRSVVDVAVAAASGCGLKLTHARREEKEGAFLVFVDEWPSPRPESSLLTVRLEPTPAGISCHVEARPLAEYGLEPPDIRAGSEVPACTPCAEARSAIPMVRYSRGLALSNAARTSRCVRGTLESAAGRR